MLCTRGFESHPRRNFFLFNEWISVNKFFEITMILLKQDQNLSIQKFISCDILWFDILDIEPRISEQFAHERISTPRLSHKPWSRPNLFTSHFFIGRSFTDWLFNLKKWAMHLALPYQNQQRLALFTLANVQILV